MSDTYTKARALILSVLMVTSVFAGVLAFSGAAAAAPPTNTAATGAQDLTKSTNTTRQRTVEIVDFMFGNAGNVSNVTVNAAQGGNANNVTPNDLDTITVKLLDSGNNTITKKTVNYNAQPKTVDFTAGNITGVKRIQVLGFVSGTAEDGDVFDAGFTVSESDGDSVGKFDTLGSQTVVVSGAGFIKGTVTDTDGNPIKNATVKIIDRSTGTVAGTLTTDSNGDFGPGKFAPGDYRASVKKKGFKSFSKNVQLATNETEDVPVTLESNRFANEVNVATWDASNKRASGENATLLANGQSSTKATFVVYSDDQLNAALNSSLTVDLQYTNTTATVGDFLDNGAINQSTTVTIPANNEADVDGDGRPESYTLVTVTSDNASKSTFTAAGHSAPLRTENFNATATNSEGTTLRDQGNVTYVLEGNESITGEVRNLDGESVANATVWVAYQAQGNKSLANTRDTFVNAEGESFLVAETNEDGEYVVHGLAGNNTAVTVFVQKSGYNRINLTDTSVNAFVAAEEDEQTEGPGARTENHDVVIASVDVDLAFKVVLDAEAESGKFKDSVDMPIRETRNVRAKVLVRSEKSTDPFVPIQDTSLVDDATVNFTFDMGSGLGSLGAANMTSDSSPLINSFTSGTSAGNVRLNATVTDAEGEVAFDTANISIFGTGTISGDVVDNQTQPVATTAEQLVRVNLFARKNTSQEWKPAADVGAAERNFVNTSSFGSDQAGHYAFTDVKANNSVDYKVNVTLVDRDSGAMEAAPGFATILNKTTGTSTADIVLDADREDLLNNSIEFNDQQTDGSSVTIRRVVLADAGFVVVRDSAGNVVGQSTLLSAGTTENLTIATDLESDQQLTAELYLDDGDGSFDADDDLRDSSKAQITIGTSGVDLNGNGQVSTTGDASTPEHEDVDGDGSVTVGDVSTLFNNLDAAGDHPDLFDFTGDGSVTVADVQALFNSL